MLRRERRGRTLRLRGWVKALGVLLVAPMRRWPAYLSLVVLGTIAAGLLAGEGPASIARTDRKFAVRGSTTPKPSIRRFTSS